MMHAHDSSWEGQLHLGTVRSVAYSQEGIPVVDVLSQWGHLLRALRPVVGLALEVGGQVLLAYPSGRSGAPFVVGALERTPEEGVFEQGASFEADGSIPGGRRRRDLVMSSQGARVVVGQEGWLALDTVRAERGVYVALGHGQRLSLGHARALDSGSYEALAAGGERVLLGRAFVRWVQGQLLASLDALAGRVAALEQALVTLRQTASGVPGDALPAGVVAALAGVSVQPWNAPVAPGDEVLSAAVDLPVSSDAEGGQ